MFYERVHDLSIMFYMRILQEEGGLLDPSGTPIDRRLIAAERRTSFAALVREALEEVAGSRLIRPRSLGIGASGHHDTARRTAEERPDPRPWR